jgi:hypothetical protein
VRSVKAYATRRYAPPNKLYDLNDDYSQAHDVSKKYPEKLKELQTLFATEAKRDNVYPIFQPSNVQPLPTQDKTFFLYREGVNRLPNAVSPRVAGRKYTITADIRIPSDGASGVIIAQGGHYGGVTLFIKGGHVVYEVNAFGNFAGRLISKDGLKSGKAHIVLDIDPRDPPPHGARTNSISSSAKPGEAMLVVNGKLEGTAHFTNLNGSSYTETLDVGSDLGSPVSSVYQSTDRFTGDIDTVSIQLR